MHSGQNAQTIGAFEAKTHLSRLLREVQMGKKFIITQRGKVVAELHPPAPPKASIGQWGDLEGKIWMAEDFCAPLEEWREYFE